MNVMFLIKNIIKLSKKYLIIKKLNFYFNLIFLIEIYWDSEYIVNK